MEVEEPEKDEEGEQEKEHFIAHVPVPSQQEVRKETKLTN